MTARFTTAMVARSASVSDPRWSPSGARLAWVVSFDGRSDLVIAPGDGDGPPVVVTGDTGVGSGYAWAGDDELVVAAGDGRLVLISADGATVRTLTAEGRALAPEVSSRGVVAFSLERDDTCELATVPLDGSEWPTRISRASYAWDPSWSPDGRLMAWHEWDLPDMPWDSSRLIVRDESGAAKVVAGGDAVAVGQPRFAPTGRRLAFISDAEGFASLWTADPDGGNAQPVLRESYEHAEPAWGPGQRSFAWSPDGEQLVWCRNEDGFGRLVIAPPDARSARELSKGWHRGLDWGRGGIVGVRSGAVTPGQVVVLAANGSGRRSVARGPVGGFEAAPPVEPRAITWKAAGATVHGLLYRPNDVDRAPLAVVVHGGPTGQALADWNPRVQWLLDRGFAVLAPNARGSTGYGRAYTHALAGRWCERDVDDVAAGIRHCIKEGSCDGSRVVVTGGSAGGTTALLVAARHPDLVRGVVALYPATDLLDLDATMHRFESGYLSRIVGPLRDAAELYRARSPLTVAADIRVPVLLLHGRDDRSVRLAHSELLAARLVDVEFHVYDGEGHGWKRAATVADELTRIDGFLTRRLGI
ncbi:MAG: S9 family peptidase [Actinomycetota bacterium]